MNQIAISEREVKTLQYQTAWIRSRKFSIENDQDLIRDYFNRLFAYEVTKPKERMLLLFQRCVFKLEGGDSIREKVIMKASDYPLMAIFFSEYIAFIEAGGEKLENSFGLHRSPLDVLARGFATLLSEIILKKRYLKVYTVEEQKDFVQSIITLLTKLVTVIELSTSVTVLKKALKDAKQTYKVSILEWATVNELPADISAELTSMPVAPVEEVPVVKPKKRKAISSLTKKELRELVEEICTQQSDLSKEEQIKVIAHIAKDFERVNDFIPSNLANHFIQVVFEEGLEFEFDVESRIVSQNKELLSEKLMSLKTETALEARIQTLLFNRSNFDMHELAEDFLAAYEKYGMQRTEELLSSSRRDISIDAYASSNSPFAFYGEDLDVMSIIMWACKRPDKSIVTVKDGVLTFADANMVKKKGIRPTVLGRSIGNLLTSKESTSEEEKQKEVYVPSSSSDWHLYRSFVRFLFELFIQEDLQLTMEQSIIAEKFLSTMQCYDVNSTYSDVILGYKIQNFEFSLKEFERFISKVHYDLVQQQGIGKKLFFNKKLSAHLLKTVSGFYSQISTSSKGSVFSKLEEATLIEWMRVLDPDLLAVAQCMPSSIATNLVSLLNEMSYLTNKAGVISRNPEPEYD